MKAKRLLLLLFTVLCFGTKASGWKECIDDIYYNLNYFEKTAEVTYRGKDIGTDVYTGDIVIPSTIIYSNETYTVTAIGEKAFNNCRNLTSITIPHSVVEIDCTFYGCNKLKEINVDENNTKYLSIDGVLYTKDKTTLLRHPAGKGNSYAIPNSVTSIGDYAFGFCAFESIIIPNSVTYIGSNAFHYCANLTAITIPNSITNIGNSAFSFCSSATSITTIPNTVTRIGVAAFGACNNLKGITVDETNTQYTSIDGILYQKWEGEYILLQYVGMENSFTIPDFVTDIGSGAFAGYCNLTTIIVPNTVTHIGDLAFSGCSSLSSITIPNSITYIGRATFSGCNGLTSIILPSSITSIGESAFSNCDNLTSVTIPNSVIQLGNYAFSQCSKLTSISLRNTKDLLSSGLSNSTFYGINTNCILYVPMGLKEKYEQSIHK